MMYRLVIVSLLIVVLTAQWSDQAVVKRQYFGQDLTQEFDDYVDWNSLKNVKKISIETKDVKLEESEYFDRIKKCFEECLKVINTKLEYRDQSRNCIAKNCDFY